MLAWAHSQGTTVLHLTEIDGVGVHGYRAAEVVNVNVGDMVFVSGDWFCHYPTADANPRYARIRWERTTL